MLYILYALLLFTSSPANELFDFNKKSDIQNWIIVNDDVMGGKSSGTFTLDTNGHGLFQGSISLENYGGFSSVRYRFDKKSVKGFTKISIKLKGDGKKYQLRIKTKAKDYYSYVASFETNGAWQEVEVNLKDMYPSFRGRKLNKPNFSSDGIEEIALLIGNKKKEHFKLLLDHLKLIK